MISKKEEMKILKSAEKYLRESISPDQESIQIVTALQALIYWRRATGKS